LIDDAHRARPLEPGVSLQELRSRLAARPELTDVVLARAIERGAIDSAGGVVRAAGWSPRFTDVQRKGLVDIEALIRAAGSEPPSVTELEPRFGADVATLLRVLERDGKVVAVEPERYYATASVAALVDRLRNGMTRDQEYSPAQLRDLLGFSRKFLIPFLEYCDRHGLTQRRAGGRIWQGA
jgi:selenocysteine-specific elongation factor